MRHRCEPGEHDWRIASEQTKINGVEATLYRCNKCGKTEFDP